MKTVTLGNTGITVNRNGFGALPIQRISVEEAGKLLRKAYDTCRCARRHHHRDENGLDNR